MILLIDNYDSFTYNLAHLLHVRGGEVRVVRNDAIDADQAESLSPSHVVISPGPGRPRDGGVTLEVLRRLAPRIPTLGVCLGHQAIVEVFGGTVGPARTLTHGKATAIRHDGRGLFHGLPRRMDGGRYHSLAATAVPPALETCATAPDGEVMAVRHRDLPVHGIQFHPESVLTPLGPDIIRNFLDEGALAVSALRMDRRGGPGGGSPEERSDEDPAAALPRTKGVLAESALRMDRREES